MPGTRCTVAVCSNSLVKTKNNPSKKYIRYFIFPRNVELRKQWVQKCRRDGKWNPDTCRVCSEHFLDSDFERDLKHELLGLQTRIVLKKGAIPSVNLGSDRAIRKQTMDLCYTVPQMESKVDIEIKEEPFHVELASAEMKLEPEEHSLSHLHLEDEDPTSSMDETNEHFPQTGISRLHTEAEDNHEISTPTSFSGALLEREGCFTARESTSERERISALGAGVLGETELTAEVIPELNNTQTSESHKKPVKRACIPEFETEESRQLSTPELQRLLLIEQLKLTRVQTAFYEKRMKTLPQ